LIVDESHRLMTKTIYNKEGELHRDQLPSQFRVASKSFTPETS
jgi:hypothetical protein